MTPDTFEETRRAAIPIRELTDAPNGLNPMFAEAFITAGAIIGLDLGVPVDRGGVFVVHGRGLMQEIAHGSSHQTHCLIVSLDGGTEELELLAAVCNVHRGGHDLREGRAS